MLHRDGAGHKGYSLPSLEGRGWGWVKAAAARRATHPTPPFQGGGIYAPSAASPPGVSTCGKTVGSAAPGA